MTTTTPDPTGLTPADPWADPGLPADERVEALLARLTLQEKVAQLSSTWEDVEPAGPDVAPGTSLFDRVGAAEQWDQFVKEFRGYRYDQVCGDYYPYE
ncbi:hypothetical protein ABZ322_32470, partial [Streptomyces sp. NPDC006129]